MDLKKEFFEAITKGDQERMMELLDRQPDLLSARLDNGLSAVLVSVYYGKTEIANLLIERKAELDIFEAAATGSTGRVKELLESNPHLLNSYNVDGFHPLGLASFFGHYDTAELLLSKGARVNSPADNQTRVTSLHSAAAGGHAGIVRLLLESGAEPNSRQQGGFTPLHSAAQNGNVESLKLLLEFGADREIQSNDNKTALEMAEMAGKEQVIEVLKGRDTRPVV
jgi:uncharacterized protein